MSNPCLQGEDQGGGWCCQAGRIVLYIAAIIFTLATISHRPHAYDMKPQGVYAIHAVQFALLRLGMPAVNLDNVGHFKGRTPAVRTNQGLMHTIYNPDQVGRLGHPHPLSGVLLLLHPTELCAPVLCHRGSRELPESSASTSIDQYPRRRHLDTKWPRHVWESTYDGSHAAATAQREWTPDTPPRPIFR